MSSGTSNQSERAGLRPIRGRQIRAVDGPPLTTVARGETFTPPCAACKCPLIRTDKACPRCGHPVPWAA